MGEVWGPHQIAAWVDSVSRGKQRGVVRHEAFLKIQLGQIIELLSLPSWTGSG